MHTWTEPLFPSSWPSITGFPTTVTSGRQHWQPYASVQIQQALSTWKTWSEPIKHLHIPMTTWVARWRRHKSLQVCAAKWYLDNKDNISDTSYIYLETQTVEECVTHADAATHLWLGTGCLNRVYNGMIDFGIQQVDGWGLPLKTLWSRLEACAEPVAESLTSDKMLVVPLFDNLSLTYSTSLWGSILILTTPSESALSFTS